MDLTAGRTGGQIKNDDCADDVKNVDLTRVHYLSGPFEVEGAEPGDLLLVEIMDVQPFQDRPWGFTGIFDRRNGVCFLLFLLSQVVTPR
jgi:formamidase